MEARFLAEEPGKIMFTMKITATAQEWEELRDQLAQKYPSWRLATMITNLLGQARKTFYEEHGAEGDGTVKNE